MRNLLGLGVLFIFSIQGLLAAENLRLREGISYFHDLDKGYPILADKIDDFALESGKPTFIFFGAAGDLNTNRQARRVVDLYQKYRLQKVKFFIVDVDHPGSLEAKHLVTNYYQGYIPGQVILDKQGKAFWNHSGEVDISLLSKYLEEVMDH